MTDRANDERTPLELAVDLLIHVPLGMLVTARDELPKLIARGRQEAIGARFIGKMAVSMGQREAEKLARRGSEKLADMGLVPDPRRPPDASAPTTSGSATSGSATEAAAPSPPAPAARTAKPPASAAAPVPAPAAPATDSLAIPGYDSLSAPQVVQRLDGLSADELESVRAYEAATRGRKTILSRIGQIQTGS